MNILSWLRDYFKNIKLVYKFSFAFFLVSLLTLVSIGLFSYYQGRSLLSEKAFELLESITRNKKERIEDYFKDIRSEILTLSQNPSTVESIKSFSDAYQEQPIFISQEKKQQLTSFYETEFVSELHYRQVDISANRNYIPPQPQAQNLQYKYLVNNPHPIGFKNQLLYSTQNDAYDQSHAKYHKSFLKYTQELDIEDILLIDAKGNIIYSTQKRPDFATNFLNGPYRSSSAARLFRRLMRKSIYSKNEEIIDFEDYDFYEPDFFQPNAFIGTVIYDDNPEQQSRIGVIIFQINSEKIQNILTNQQNWEQEGLGNTGESALIGPDYLIRNNTRRFLEDPLAYTQNLADKQVDSLIVNRIQRLKTTILLRQYKIEASVQAIENGKSGSQERTDFLGGKVLDVYAAIDVLGTRWAVITEIDAAEIFKSVRDLQINLLLIAFIISIIVGILGYTLARTLTRPMLKIGREISMLAQGTFPKLSKHIYNDELGKIDLALNQLIINMQEVAHFAENVGEERFETPFDASSQQDALRNALLKMRDNLKKVSEDEKIRSWMSTGNALFGEILRNNSESLTKLAEFTIAELVQYLNANQGAFFVWQEESKELQILAAFAYDKQKYMSKSIKAGEGLVGQVYLEKYSIFLSQIPEDYTEIRSGLGKAPPSCLLLVPIQTPEKVLGVLEIASFNVLKDFEVKFVETIAENIATTIQGIRINEETKRLLIESQQSAELMKRQEEEMRQSFEDLINSQEEVRQKQKNLDELLLQQMFEPESEQTKSEDNPRASFENRFQSSNNRFDKKINDVIERQKKILDEAWKNNKEHEDKLKEKVSKIDFNYLDGSEE